MGFFDFLGKAASGVFKAVTSPVSLVLDLASGVTNAVQQNSINKENNRNQRVENEANREFNAQMMREQNQFALDQWNRQNEYNSAQSQMSRAIAAGLNPNLVASSIGGSSPALSPMSAASSQGSVSPSSVNPRYGDIISQALANERERAEINYIKAQTKGQDVTNDILSTEASFAAAMKQSQLDLTNSTVYLNEASQHAKESEIKLMRHQMYKIDTEVNYITSQVDQIKATISNIDADTVIKKIDAFYKSDLYKSQISEIVSRTHLNYTQANDLVQTLTSRLLNLQAGAYSSIEGTQSIGVDDNGQLTFDFRNNKSVSDTLREVELTQKITSSLGGIFDSLYRKLFRKTGNWSTPIDVYRNR